jgi:hypothetical protein
MRRRCANGARNAEWKEAGGWRWDETVKDLKLREESVPKAVWNEFFVGLGFAWWKTKSALFSRDFRGIGVGGEVYAGQADHVEVLLAICLRDAVECRCVVSRDAIR